MHGPLRDRLPVPDTDNPAAVQARTIMKATDSLLTRTGAQVLVDALKIHGVDTAFGVPGESYLAVLDALYDARDAIKFVTCRQEGGATNMAEAYGKMTGRP